MTHCFLENIAGHGQITPVINRMNQGFQLLRFSSIWNAERC